MMSMRTAIMSNPTLAATVRQNEEQRRVAAQLRGVRRVKAQRDAAIVALIKARKAKKRSRPLLTRVLECVAQVRAAEAALAA